jgi:hypothetical protein
VLTSYLNATARLLQNPAATNPLYATADLTIYINTARGQIAGQEKCIRAMGSLTLTIGTNGPYLFSSIVFPTSSAVSGISGAFNVQTAWYQVGTGQKWVTPRSWPWFSLYNLNNPVLGNTSGPPADWAQLGQGTSGSLYFDPPPDFAYVVPVDCACKPIDLVDDMTVEAIPPLWTDAVPYFAAYLALLSAQTGVRTQEADAMFKRHEMFAQRARVAATSQIVPYQQEGTPNLMRANQLGQPPSGPAGG